MTTPELFQQQLDQLLAPMREQLEAVDRGIDAKQREMNVLRETRRKIVRVLGAADAAPVKPGPKGGPKTKTPTNKWKVSPAKLGLLADWLRQHHTDFDGDEFTGPAIERHDDFSIMSRASLVNALHALAEQGVVRLDHVGGSTGNARVYKMVDHDGRS